MKFSLQHLSSLLLLQGVQLAKGHYGFPVVSVNGVLSEWYQYVRPVDQFGNIIVCWDCEPQVCGFNGTKTGHQTNTLNIEAGSSLGFRVFHSGATVGQKPYPNDTIYHPGPGQAYMSKAPGALGDYEGDGDWFKIGSSVSSDGQYWDSYNKIGMNFTIPKTTPPGKYLLRVEHFNISPFFNETQQFINCAHVEVTGPGGGTPGPMIKFPGGYNVSDPAIWLPRALYNPYKPTPLLKAYKGAGPEVWSG